MTQGKWQIDFVKKAKKEFEKLPKDIQSRIVDFFNDRVISSDNPYVLAKSLTGDKGDCGDTASGITA